MQDTDAAFMLKVDLEAKLDGLSDEIEFLRQIYDAVMTLFFKFHIFDLKTKGITKMMKMIILFRKSLSCRARSRTHLLWWRWTTVAFLTWMPSSLKCAPSMKTSPTAAEPRLSHGTRPR